MMHSEVAQAFADGATKGKGNRMFIEEDTIYSHGTHYPIARRFAQRGIDYLFNTYYGSCSTERHRSYVRRVLSGKSVLIVRDCDIENAGKQWNENVEEIAKAEGKLKRTRLHKDGWKERILELEAQNDILAQIAVRQRLLKATEVNGSE